MLAKMFLIFVLAREDVLPVEDLGVRRGMEQLYSLDTREAMVEKAEEWRPYRSIAARHLWKATENWHLPQHLSLLSGKYRLRGLVWESGSGTRT